jgi:hypothetical protein
MSTQPHLQAFLQKLRKRRIIETLAAFIGGGLATAGLPSTGPSDALA